MELEERCRRYGRAELTVISLNVPGDRKEYTMYSLLELCPVGQIPSNPIPQEEKKITMTDSSGKQLTATIHRFFIKDALNAAQYYRSEKAHSVEKQIFYDYLYQDESLKEESVGQDGLLVNAVSDKKLNVVSVLPRFSVTIRLFAKCNRSRRMLELAMDPCMTEFCHYVTACLGIDLQHYREYLGGVFLCCPDNILRHVEARLGRGSKILLLKLRYREGMQSQNKCQVELTDRRDMGDVYISRQPIESSRVVIDLPAEPERLLCRIFDDSGELIEQMVFSFLKRINFSMGIHGRTRVIEQNGHQDHVPETEYVNFSVGHQQDDEYERRLQSFAEARRLESLERSREFIFFPGDKIGHEESQKKAIKIVRELLQTARERCIICDPCFGAWECQAFGPYMNNRNISLCVVTSAAFLLEEVPSLTEDESGQEVVARYIELKKVLRTFQNKQIAVKCFVALQSNLAMQARFIVIDRQVYILGSSLHKFGGSPTVLYRLPVASSMIRIAKEWLRQDSGLALPFEDWLATQIIDL